MSEWWSRDLYTTTDFDSLVSKRITEYDIREAGYNLTIYYNLLSKKKIEYLSKLSKAQRHIQIGIFMRDDKDYSENLTNAFGKMRKQFIDDNGLKKEDILSIKKDAIFVIGKSCTVTSYGNVSFIAKNTYTSYHRLNGLEMYYNSSQNTLDIKGISEDMIPNNSKFINILKRCFKYLDTGDHKSFCKFIKKFTYDYKNKNLMYEYYRELNGRSMYALIAKSDDIFRYYVSDIGDSTFDDSLDISYNYVNYILPLIQRFFFESYK